MQNSCDDASQTGVINLFNFFRLVVERMMGGCLKFIIISYHNSFLNNPLSFWFLPFQFT